MGTEGCARNRKDSPQSRSRAALACSIYTSRVGSFSTHDWFKCVRMGNTEDVHRDSENSSLSAFTRGAPRADRHRFEVLQLLSGRAMEIWIEFSSSCAIRRQISHAEGNVDLSRQSDNGRNAS